MDVTLAELHQLRERVYQQQIEGDDWVVVGALISRVIAHTEARQARLRAKAAQQAAQDDADSSSNAEDAAPKGEPSGPAVEQATEHDEPPSTEQDEPKKGHGRNGADAFNGMKIVHPLAAGILGSECEACGKGRVSRYRTKVIIRVIGQSLFGAEHHAFEQGRCRLCGGIVTAEGRELVRDGIGSDYITYGWSACAMLIVMHYFAGAPFKRLEALHQGWGVPMPDANQWRIADECDDLLAPLYNALERHGIQNATALRIDDTGSMIIETRQAIRQEILVLEQLGESTKHVRTGINATGVYLEVEGATVVLFFTGRHHAGEIIDRLLEHRRAGANKLVSLTDAASKNFAHSHTDKLEEGVCNAHCYLKFRAIKDQFPAEHAVAGEVYKKVFDNDDKAKALGLEPRDRMLYHRAHSKPQMQRLWQMCRDKLDQKLVEPNSPLWEPVSYVINQWPRLTKFYEVAGVPLDTNVLEQALIIPVRYLAGSFAYKTQNGAEVGDRHMSLIATANANGVEPVDYLTECLRNHEDLAKRPEHYFPWVYRDRCEQLGGGKRAQAPPSDNHCAHPATQVRHPLRPGVHRRHRPPDTSGATGPLPAGLDHPDAATASGHLVRHNVPLHARDTSTRPSSTAPGMRSSMGRRPR